MGPLWLPCLPSVLLSCPGHHDSPKPWPFSLTYSIPNLSLGWHPVPCVWPLGPLLPHGSLSSPALFLCSLSSSSLGYKNLGFGISGSLLPDSCNGPCQDAVLLPWHQVPSPTRSPRPPPASIWAGPEDSISSTQEASGTVARLWC